MRHLFLVFSLLGLALPGPTLDAKADPPLAMPVTVPLQNTTDHLLIYASFNNTGGTPNVYPYVLDTGSFGFFTATGTTSFWTGSTYTPNGNNFTIGYGTNGSLVYSGVMGTSTISLNDPVTVSGTTSPARVSVANATFGVVTNQPYANTAQYPGNYWDNQVNSNPPQPPEPAGTYGTLGAGFMLLSSIAGATTSVLSQIPIDKSLDQGYIIHSGSATATDASLQIGISSHDLARFATLLPMRRPDNGPDTTTTSTGQKINLYAEDQLTGTITLVNPQGETYVKQLKVIVDSGGLSPNFAGLGSTFAPSSDFTTQTTVDGQPVTILAPGVNISLTVTGTNSTPGLDWSFTAGTIPYVNQVSLGAAKTDAFNTGIAIYRTYDVMFDTTKGWLGVDPLNINLNTSTGTYQGGGLYQGFGTFKGALGAANDQVQWTGSGGFSAQGLTSGQIASLIVNIDGAATPDTLQWGQKYFVSNGQSLDFGSPTSNGTVLFENSLNLSGTVQTILVTQGIVSAPGANISGNISNGGLIVGDAADVGTLVLSGTNTYAGPTTVSAGTLRAGSTTGFSALSAFSVASGATLDLGGFASSIGSLAGSGVVTNSGTTIAALTTGADNTSTTFSGVIQNGTSPTALIKTGTGTLILSGLNTYTGGTTLQSGTLKAGSNSAFGTGDLTIEGGTVDLNGFSHSLGNISGPSGTIVTSTGSATLTFNETADPVFGGTIEGSIKTVYNGTAASHLVLTGSHTYTDGTTINSGTVIADNSDSFGVGDLVLHGGNLVVGTTPAQVLHIHHDYRQDLAGTLILSIASPVVYNTMMIDGAAQLGGSLVVNVLGNYVPGAGQTFNLIEATGGITGQFASVTNNVPIPPTLLSTLNLTNSGNILSGQFSIQQLPFAPYAQTPNQRSVAHYIDTYDQYYGGNAFPLVVAGLNTSSYDSSTLASALDQLTPAKFGNFTTNNVINNAAFATQQFDSYLESLRSGQGTFVSSADHIDASGLAMLNPSVDPRLAQLNSRLLAYNPAPLHPGLLSDSAQSLLAGTDMKALSPQEPADLWNVFLQGNVVLGQSFSGSDTPYGTSTTSGMEVGFDYKFTPHFLAGLAFGYNHTNATLDNLGSNATVNSYAPTLFASYVDGGWYGNALVTYGFNQFNENRAINFGGYNATANGSPGGRQQVFNLDGGYDIHSKHWTFGPTLGLQYTHFNVNNYTETGAPGANLAVSSQADDSLRSRLGAHMSYAAQIKNIAITPHLDLSWQHEYLNQSSQLYSSFTDVGTGSFAITTPNGSKDSALIDAGFNIQASENVSVFVDYLAQAGQSNYFGQSVQAGVKIGF